MKKLIFISITTMALIAILSRCGYKERGHANTPAEAPGDQTKPGIDTLAHPGNIDKDTIKVE
jgi:hypothetical protein